MLHKFCSRKWVLLQKVEKLLFVVLDFCLCLSLQKHFKSHKEENLQEGLKKQANNKYTERKNLEKNSDDLFTLDFFDYGENI